MILKYWRLQLISKVIVAVYDHNFLITLLSQRAYSQFTVNYNREAMTFLNQLYNSSECCMDVTSEGQQPSFDRVKKCYRDGNITFITPKVWIKNSSEDRIRTIDKPVIFYFSVYQ